MNLIIKTDDAKYNMHCEEYKILWESIGEKIQQAYKKILGLNFNEDNIVLLINEGYNFSNFSGNSTNDIINYRYNNRSKIGTFLHELSHRIVLEYSLYEKAKKIYNMSDIHELIDLFLYDVIELLFGTKAAQLRVEYESNFEEDVYKNSWDKALKLSFEERQEMLNRIKEVSLNEE